MFSFVLRKFNISYLNKSFLLLIVSLSYLLLGMSAASSIVEEQQNEQDYLLNVYLAEELRTQSLPAYRIGEQLYLHFDEFIELTEFAIAQSGANWEGWSYHQNHEFKLLTEQSSVKSKLDTFFLTDSSITYIADELYVNVGDIAKWFDLAVNQRLATQTLRITSPHTFAFQGRKTREARVQYLNSQSKIKPLVIDDQYHLWTSPRTFFQAQHQLSRRESGTRYNTSIAATSSFDFLYHQTFFAGNVSNSSEAAVADRGRLTFSKRAPKKNAELFLDTAHYQFGDIYLNEPGLLGISGSGLGFEVQRNFQSSLSRSEGALITGNAPPGWDAELYKNGQLLGLVKVDEQGRYVFSEQPTAFGLNKFEVRIYGPQGQVDIESHNVWGGGQLLNKGEYGYRLAHVDYTTELLNGEIDNADVLPIRNTAMLQGEWGITDHIMLGLGVYNVDGQWSSVNPLSPREPFINNEQYLGVELQADIYNGVGYAELLKQDDAGTSVMLGYRANLGEHLLNYEFQQLDDNFYSPFSEQLDNLKARQRLLFNGPLDYWFNSYQLRINYDRLHGTDNKFSAILKTSKQWQRTFLHHTLEYEGRGSLDHRYRGKFEATARFNDVSLSGAFNYRIEQGMYVDQFQLTARWRPHREVYATSRLSHTIGDTNLTILQQQFSLETKWANINMHISFGSDDYLGFGIGISSYFGEGKSQRRNLMYHARAEIIPFLDKNGNNKHEEGEPLIDDAYWHRANSERRSLLIDDLPGQYETNVSLDALILPDPYLAATPEALQFYTHPGAMLKVPVPIRYTGDIEGRVTLSSNPQQKITGLELVLLDENKKIVARTFSEFDGYFGFTSIPTGRYLLQYQNGHDGEMESKWITLDPEDAYVNVRVVIDKSLLD